MNTCIIGIPEGEEREKGAGNLFEVIIAENFSNLGKETDIQDQESQRVPNRINSKRNRPRHIVIKTAKIKDKKRILKAPKGKQQVMYKGTPMRLSVDFSAETLQVKKSGMIH